MELMWRVRVEALENSAPQVQENAVCPEPEACCSSFELVEKVWKHSAHVLCRCDTLLWAR